MEPPTAQSMNFQAGEDEQDKAINEWYVSLPPYLLVSLFYFFLLYINLIYLLCLFIQKTYLNVHLITWVAAALAVMTAQRTALTTCVVTVSVRLFHGVG